MRENNTPAGGTGLVRGGMGTVSEAIALSGARFGMKTRVDSDVASIVVENGRARGVALADGEVIHGDVVISNASARHTFLSLVPENMLPAEFLTRLRSFGGRACLQVHRRGRACD